MTSDTGMSFLFEFELEPREQVRASRIMSRRRLGTRAMYVMFVPGLLLAVALHVWNVFPTWLRLTGTAVVAASVVLIAVDYLAPYWRVRSLRDQNRAAAGPVTYRLSDRGIDATSLGANSSVEWANVIEAFETHEFLLFYFAKEWAITLPKRIMKGEELLRLRSALRGWLPERARLLNGSRHKEGDAA